MICEGGFAEDWDLNSKMYYGGTNPSDALKLLNQAHLDFPSQVLSDLFRVEVAQSELRFPCSLSIPRDLESIIMKNLNNDVTAGPFLWAFAIKKKYGLKLEEFMFGRYDAYAYY